MKNVKEVVVQTELATEIAKTLAEGFEISFRTRTYVGSALDIVVRAEKPGKNFIPSSFSEHQIRARDIYEFGSDLCYSRAVHYVRENLKKLG